MTSDAERTKECLVLIAHGSREERWTLPFLKLAQALKAELGENRVHLAFMEFSRPSLLDVAGDIVGSGILEFQLLPLFMSSGSHFAHDLPEQVEKAHSTFPGLEINLLPPVGQNPEFFEFIHALARGYVD
jgi:sirohydrochlorin cobaltochelatase